MKKKSKHMRRSADNTSLQHSFDAMIRSVSGWRKVFAPTEHSRSSNITPADHILLLLAANSFAEFLQKTCSKKDGALAIAIARDRRPTSATIARTMVSAFRAAGLNVYNRAVCPSPEIMAYVAENDAIHGFCYITASHNPIGHNGFKFGDASGMVLKPEDGKELIRLMEDRFDAIINLKPSNTHSHTKASEGGRLYWGRTIKEQARASYKERLRKALLLGSEIKTLATRPISILIDANGCARAKGADREWLADMGLGCTIMAKHRVRHAILPEGSAMDGCMRKLERLSRKDPSYQLGYVSDGDGDRGNIVYIDPNTAKACRLSPQDTFATLVLARLTFLQKTQTTQGPLAIVINAATSHAIVRIAEMFDVRVFITETGEANICAGISLAEASGYRVAIAGEGSNGGAIIPPHLVRDPLLAITVLLQYLNLYPEKHISDLLAELPQYQCTHAVHEKAVLRLNIQDRIQLVKDYITLLYNALANLPPTLKDFGISAWRHLRYDSSNVETLAQKPQDTSPLPVDLEKTSGGHVVELLAGDLIKARMWMRPSATEAIIRIMADVEGSGEESRAVESFLLDMQRAILYECADKQADK